MSQVGWVAGLLERSTSEFFRVMRIFYILREAWVTREYADRSSLKSTHDLYISWYIRYTSELKTKKKKKDKIPFSVMVNKLSAT